ncbi:MAG TPA: DUF1499 domain-containing protein [Longimicrobiales bacterium]|nr:DUF1499 domain-containing protein [Longimicrobiales bacterium]
MRGLVQGLTRSGAATDPSSPDALLRGRTYAIPFEDVWNAAVRIAAGELRGWGLLRADDRAGLIEAEVQAGLFGSVDDVRIRIGLDENAQTRVDLEASARSARGDLGRNRRSIGRFLKRLDRALAPGPNQILDPSRIPAWLEQA